MLLFLTNTVLLFTAHTLLGFSHAGTWLLQSKAPTSLRRDEVANVRMGALKANSSDIHSRNFMSRRSLHKQRLSHRLLQDGVSCGGTFASSCPIASLGTFVPLPGSSLPFVVLTLTDVFFFQFQMPVDTHSVFIDFTVQFGTIAVFAAKNREPTPLDYDFTNSNSDSSNAQQLDHLSITSLHHTREDTFNVLVMSAAALAGSKSGMSEDACFRAVVASASSPIVVSVDGVLQTLRLGAGTSMHLTFPVSADLFASETGPRKIIDVLITNFGGSESMPALAIVRPGSTDAAESGYFLNSTNLAEGYASFTPSENEIGNEFTLSLDGSNLSFVSVTMRVGGQASPDIAIETGKHIVLSNGFPFNDKVGEWSENFYVFYVPPDADGDVTITVDPRQGDADLFVNTNERGFYSRRHTAGQEPSVWSSQLPSGQDRVVIRRNDPNYLRGRDRNGQSLKYYCITVFGFRSAEFTLHVSTQNSATILMEGYVVEDSVSEDSYKYYRFHDTEPSSAILFDLLPHSGDADLYISCFFTPTGDDEGIPSSEYGHFNFSSAEYLEDEIRISPEDPNSCSLGSKSDTSTNRGQGGVFYLAVYGYSDVSYMLGAQHSGSERILVAGVESGGTVFKLSEQRYKLRLGYEAADLSILLSPSYGDADLFIGLDRLPTQTSFDYVSNNYGTNSDTVTVSEKDVCSDCWIHILVYGYATTSYGLLATLTDGTIVLQNGVSQRGSVASNAIQYYRYQTTASDCDIMVVATMLSGGVDGPSLYLSTIVQNPNSTSPNTLVRSSDSGEGALAKLWMRNVNSAATSIFIGVGGDGSNVTYNIRISESPLSPNLPPTLLTLSNGIPQIDSIEPDDSYDWLYYKIAAPIGHESINVRLVPIIGVLDMYMLRCSAGTSSYKCALPSNLPNETHYAVTTAGDFTKHTLTLYRNDEQESLYVVGVRSLSYYAAYQISSSFENSILALQEGVAVMDHVNAGEVDYFSFPMPSNSFEALHFTLTTISGDPDMYVSTSLVHPSQDNNTWQSFDYGSDVIVIDPQVDQNACVDCIYYVAVVGSIEATYTILASRTSTLPKMVDGVPSSDGVSQSHWSYFTFRNTYGATRDITVTLTTTTGNADLYATLDGTLPTTSNYAYSSNNDESSDQIIIMHNDEVYDVCIPTQSYWRSLLQRSLAVRSMQRKSHEPHALEAGYCIITIGVFGVTDAEFSVTLSSTSSATLLQFGVSLTGSVPSGSVQVFRAQPSARSTSAEDSYTLRFSITPLSGHVSVYVSCRVEQPNATNYDWNLSPVPGTGGFLDINGVAAEDKGCLSSTATYFAAIVGDTAATFSLIATLVDDETAPLLISGVQVPGNVQYHKFNYYFFRPRQYNSEAFEDIRLLVTVVQGDVDIYISASWDTRPRLNPTGEIASFLTSSTSAGSEDMLIKHDWIDHHCSGRDSCYFIVGVFGHYQTTDPGSVPSAGSTYSVLMSNPDSTMTLINGVPRRSHVESGRIEYFKYSLTQPNLDLVIAVSPISGDPDLYISLFPVLHPDRTNYTWHQSKFGADTLTLQYTDIANHCVPDPSRPDGRCDFYIGVYGWENSTFTILAAIKEGFRSPITLIDLAPQSGSVLTGEYAYYQYLINVPSDGEDSLPVDVKFTLTPTDQGDVDLYLKFAKNADNVSADEPGRSNYDLKSTGFANVVEEIEISADMQEYCLNCIVYIAVYGYAGGSYTLQASSDGFVDVQAAHAIGGHVDNGQYRYYRFQNTLQFAILTITLTTIAGDADIYINTAAHGSSGPRSGEKWLPARDFYTWRSINSGNDVVHIDYEDVHYCDQCDYLIAIYGFSNSTYTLLVTDVEDNIIKLVPNRPQIAEIDASNKVLYFSALITSSAADLTVSLTAIDSGTADMFIEVYNTSAFYGAGGGDNYVLPDPSDPSTYSYSTKDTTDSHVFLPGPHEFESMLIITVKATSESGIQFSIVATSSQFPVLLLDSIPQSHYVEHGQNEFFVFFPLRDEDLRITLTAQSGDPDLFVSSAFPPPHCDRIEDSGQMYIECLNYTWSSRNYMTDQIILSRDYPCAAVVPTTTVATTCDPTTAFQPALGTPIFIDVYGFSSAKFTILASPVGQQIQLLPGKPQLSTTSLGYICSERSNVNGACLSSSAVSKQIQVAYFSFVVNKRSKLQVARRSRQQNKQLDKKSNQTVLHAQSYASLRSVFDVIFTIVPECNSSISISAGGMNGQYFSAHRQHPMNHGLRGVNSLHQFTGGYDDFPPIDESRDAVKISEDVECAPGCPCNPLVAYISSCAASACSETDKKPSEIPGQHQLRVEIDPDIGSTVFTSSFINANGGTSLCDPGDVAEACNYYVAVTTSLPPDSAVAQGSTSASFTIAARTPGDSILIPCSAKSPPDGVKFSALDRISYATGSDDHDYHYFELCSQLSSGSHDHSLQEYTSQIHDIISLSESANENLIVQLEQCAGETILYACAEDNNCILPSESSWGYFSDGVQSCSRNWRTGSTACSSLKTGIPEMTLPQQKNNFHIMAKGDGSFQLTVTQTQQGLKLTPKLVYAGMHTSDAAAITVVRHSGNTVSLRWRQVQVLIPGILSPGFADDMIYSIYIFDEAAVVQARRELDPVAATFKLDSACGLELGRSSLPEKCVTVLRTSVSPDDRHKEFMTHTVRGLSTKTKYQVAIIATCDGNCLRQFSKLGDPKQLMSCSTTSVDCKSQNAVFNVAHFVTGTKSDDHSNGDDGDDSELANSSDHSSLIILTLIILAFLLCGSAGAACYFFKTSETSLFRLLGFQGGQFSSEQAMSVGVNSELPSWMKRLFGGNANRSGRGDWTDGMSSSHGLTEMVERSKFTSNANSGSSDTGLGENIFVSDVVTSAFGLGGKSGESRLKDMKKAHKSARGKRDHNSFTASAEDPVNEDAYQPPAMAGTKSSTTFNILHNADNVRTSGSKFVVTDEDDEEGEELLL